MNELSVLKAPLASNDLVKSSDRNSISCRNFKAYSLTSAIGFSNEEDFFVPLCDTKVEPCCGWISEKQKLTRSTDCIILFRSTLFFFSASSLTSVKMWMEMMLRQSIVTRATSSFCFWLLRSKFWKLAMETSYLLDNCWLTFMNLRRHSRSRL